MTGVEREHVCPGTYLAHPSILPPRLLLLLLLFVSLLPDSGLQSAVTTPISAHMLLPCPAFPAGPPTSGLPPPLLPNFALHPHRSPSERICKLHLEGVALLLQRLLL